MCPLLLAIDERNNDVAIGGTFTWGFGFIFPADANASVVHQVSNARTIDQLSGGFSNVGVGALAGPGVVASGFWGQACGAPGGTVIGGEAGIGTGAGLAFHAQETYSLTQTYLKFNPTQFVQQVISWFRG